MLKIIKNLFRRGWRVHLPSAASSYSLLIERLEKNEPFSFSRWGDGEWEAVLGLREENESNCDGHQYFPSLKEGLHQILISDPPSLFGMQKLAYHKLIGREIDTYLKKYSIQREWLNADAFHIASSNGKIRSFFNLLATKKILLVGPAHLRRLKLFDFDFCEVPEKNCWLHRERVIHEIKEIVERKEPEVILFCAGMTSNWFVDQLNPWFAGFVIDVGSLLDPYAGKNSRNYHNKLNTEIAARGLTDCMVKDCSN